AGRGSQQAALLADLPFMSYQASVEDAVRNAGRLAKEAGAQAVKLEGGREFAEHIRAITASGLPVMGHLGLTPQSIHHFGGYGKQGKTEQAATRLLEDARIMEEAGMVMVVLENIPHQLARDITDALKVPTIGIGAGPHCDGQVQVLHDLLGLIPDFRPRHAVRYAEHGQSTREAISRYAEDVRSGNFVSE
ncbi:MAG: 3-methyl-2-oxobutanoate hydroxymethyltransferase, partial [Deltaproteobacteria bacterium]|nr:3-methyl-2-oxobutanoate hydroxymethyltransferase [Deltaproteobacteria bacterium]